jgi:hypothetical protein
MGSYEHRPHSPPYILEQIMLECDPKPWMAFRNKRMHHVGFRALRSDGHNAPAFLDTTGSDVLELHPFSVPCVRPQCTPVLHPPALAPPLAVPRTPAPRVFIHQTYTAPPAPGPAAPPAQEDNMPHGMHLLQVHRISDELRRRLCSAD